MKKSILIILLTVAVFSLKAQKHQSPLFFHNHLEYMMYQIEHPERVPLKAMESSRTDYTQKLDSVIGSDDFDLSRWKNTYTYENNLTVETSYEWQNNAWVPTVKTESDNATNTVISYRWTDDAWELEYKKTSQYLDCEAGNLLESTTTEQYVDSEWAPYSYSTYEYDDNCHLVLNVNYYGVDGAGEWKPNSKLDCSYNAEGLLVRELTSTIRNGNWRESSLDSLFYNEQNQCVNQTFYYKGGWGPGSNTWMLSGRYEFSYTDGQLTSEILYAAGWFGGGMTLDSKSEYFFDAKGNEELKTSSVYNEEDWIVRDSYTNTYDLSVDAASIQGLASVWESTKGTGMGSSLDEMPLNSKWLSCTIISSYYDTHFDLYYSGPGAVEEHQEKGIRAYSRQGGLVVEFDESADVTVYDLLGRVVASKEETMQCEFSLTPGVYIVSNGSVRVKAVVR
jgi:hypothetical protein